MTINNIAIGHTSNAAIGGDWEPRACSNAACSSSTWLAKRIPSCDDVWWVAQHPGDCAATVAATVPVCPRCGSNLAFVQSLLN